MSRAYTLQLKQSLRRTVVVDDGVRSTIELLDVLPRPAMADLLRARLRAAGFEDAEDGTLVRVEDDGVRVAIDPEARTVTVRAQDEAELELEAEATVRTYEETKDRDEARGRARLDAQLEAEAEAAEGALKAEVSARLEARLGDLRGELDRLGNEVVADALERRAAQLGRVTAVSRDGATGEITIKVEL